jgi:D-alanyl-D-alanine carboxypeptidase
MKRSVFTVLALAFCYATFADAAEGKGTLGAELSRVNMPGGKLAYVVMDAHTGQVLASRSPTQSLKILDPFLW